MTRSATIRTLAVLAFICLPVVLRAQTNKLKGTGKPTSSRNISNNICKKRTTRTVQIELVPDSVDALTNDDPLMKVLAMEILEGKISAYAANGELFTTKLTKVELQQILIDRRDTLYIQDPIIDSDVMKIAISYIKFRNIHKIKVVEDWQYHPTSGKIDIQIAGIAPILAEYNDEKQKMEYRSLFYVKYQDILPLLTKYYQTHKCTTIAMSIWNSHFQNDNEGNSE